jgi:hypothetical protein
MVGLGLTGSIATEMRRAKLMLKPKLLVGLPFFPLINYLLIVI